MLFFIYIAVTAGKVAGGQDVKEYISLPRLKADGSGNVFHFAYRYWLNDGLSCGVFLVAMRRMATRKLSMDKKKASYWTR
jgi:hypothetical protein